VIDYNAVTGDSVTTAAQKQDIALNDLYTNIVDGTAAVKGIVQLGTTASTAAPGDHLHTGVYQPAGSYAASGANSDITSLTGLTTPLSVAQGGTGGTTALGTAAYEDVATGGSGDLLRADGDGSQLTNLPGSGPDGPAFDAFVAWIAASRASGARPSGYMWMFAADELATKTNASYDAAGRYYHNQPLTTGGSGYTNNGTWAANQTAIDRNYALPSGVTVDKIGVYSTSALSVTVKVALENSSTNYTIVVSQTFPHTGSGWEDFSLSSSYTIPATGTYRLGVYAPSTIVVRLSSARSYIGSNATGTVSATADAAEVPLVRASYRSGANNMTLVPAPFTPPGTPTKANMYLLHRSIDSVTLGTDVKIRATGDNGSSWSGYATISSVCDFDSSFKFLKASATLPVAGTQVKWEITTYNTKAQQVRAVLVEAS